MDFRAYDHKYDEKTRNDYFRDMFNTAKKTWSCVALCPNRQLIFRYGGSQTCQEASMAFFTLLNSNLLVKEVKSGYIAISEVNILDGGGLVHFWWIWFN